MKTDLLLNYEARNRGTRAARPVLGASQAAARPAGWTPSLARWFAAWLMSLAPAPALLAQQTVSLTANPTRLTVSVNTTEVTTSAITVTIAGGAEAVNLSVSGLPDGASASFDASTFTESGTASLTLTTMNVAQGDYELAIEATGGAQYRLPMALHVGHVWSGAAGTAWAESGNWVGGAVPGAADAVVFANAGAAADETLATVALAGDTEVASLRFKHGGGATRDHHVQIPPGATLRVTGPGGFLHLRDELPSPDGSRITFSGGGALVVSNPDARFALLVDNQQESRLDLDQLGALTVDVERIALGDYALYPHFGTNGNATHPRRFRPRVWLARTNVLRATFADPNNYTNAMERHYAFLMGRSFREGTSASVDLFLGQTNAFYLDSVCFMGALHQGTVSFNSAFAGNRPVVVFRGPDGGRMSVFTLADSAGPVGGHSNTRITVDLSAGVVDALVDRLYLSRDRPITDQDGMNTESTLTLGAGVFEVNTAVIGFQEQGNHAARSECRGTLNVNATALGDAVFVVNDTLELGHTTADFGDPTGAENGFGRLNINGGVVRANNIRYGGVTRLATTSAITMTGGGQLVISNTLATAEAPLPTLNMSDSVLTLHLDGTRTEPYVYVTDLVTGGGGNTIEVASITGVDSFPAQVALIAYENASLNFSVRLPAGFFGYLINNVANQTVDVVISTNPPASLVWDGAVDGNWDTATPNWKGGQTFANGDAATFNDEAAGSTVITVIGSVIPGADGVTISNTVKNYTFRGGTIAGTARMEKWGGGLLTIDAASENLLTIQEGTVTGTGAIGGTTVAAGAALRFAGAVNGGLDSAGTVLIEENGAVHGPVTIRGGSFVNAGAVSTVPGTLTLLSGVLVTNLPSGLLEVGGGNWSVEAGSTLANFGQINNLAGRLNVNAGATLMGTGTFSDFTGDANRNNGRVAINNGGVLSPGDHGIGTLVVEGRLDLNPGSRTIIEVDLNHPATNDVLGVDKLSNFRGTIVLSNIGAVPFAAGQSFLIVSNNFGLPNTPEARQDFVIEPAAPGPGLAWDVSNLTTNGILSIISLGVDPTPTNLTFSVAAGNQMKLSWPASHVGWQLLVQTNHLARGLSLDRADWALVPGSESVNEVTVPIDPAEPAKFYQLILP